MTMIPVYVGYLTQSFAKSVTRFEIFDHQSISLQFGEKDTWKRGIGEHGYKLKLMEMKYLERRFHQK